MNEQMNPPALPPPSGVSEWFSVWRDAITKPSDQTYARIATSPNAKTTTALLWVFIGSRVSFFVTSLVPNQALRQLMQNSNFGNGQGFPAAAGGGLVSAICGAPIGAIISVVIFAIVVGILQLVAKMFGGRGTFDQLAYAMAAIQTPVYFVSALLGLLAAIPFVGLCFSLVSLAIGIYVLVLQVMAVKGVNQFGWGQAVGSCAIPFLVILCCFAVGVVAFLRLLGPQINNIFNSIQQSLP